MNGKANVGVLLALVLCFACAVPVAAERERTGAGAGPGGGAIAVVIPIHGEIDGVTALSVDRRLDQVLAMSPRPRFIIFDMDTWGGELHATFEIADRIAEIDPKIEVVAYVSKKAISAGALIAITCRTIAMRPGTRIGDCEPILVGGEGGIQTAPEKMKSPIREHFESNAARNGYPVPLAIVMVDKEEEVVKVTLEPEDGGAGPRTDEFVLRRTLEEWPLAKQRRVVHRTTVVPKGQLLTMSETKARDFGFARWIVDDVEDLRRKLEAAAGEPLSLKRIDTTAWEDFVSFLNSQEIKTLLLMLGMLGILIELKAPGLIIPAAVGIGCLALAFFGSYLAGLAEVIEIVLVLLGVGLLAVELFVIPGFGVTGIAGICCIALGIILSLQSFTLPETPWEFGRLKENVLVFFIGLGLAMVAFVAVIRFLPETRFLSRIVLKASQRPEDGYTVASSARVALLGRVAVAATALRPAGKVDLDDERLDAIAEGEYSEAGERVEIVETDENRLIVRRPEVAGGSGTGTGTGTAAGAAGGAKA